MKFFFDRRNINIVRPCRFLLALALFMFLGPGYLMAQTEAESTPDIQAVRPSNPPKTFLLVVPQSGPLANLGQQARQGAEVAMKTWGGGFNLEVIDEGEQAVENIDFNKIAVVIGYFTESAFHRDAPRYIYLKKPVLLPYLTNAAAAALGPDRFYNLMAAYEGQGQFMAMEILNMKTRYGRILIIQGEGENQAELAEALKKTLAEPVQPKPLAADSGKTNRKPAPRVKPLDSKAQVVTVDLEQALKPDSIQEFSKRPPELIILAVDLLEAMQVAPVLADSKFAKTPLWGGVNLGLRDTGAAFAFLKLRLSLCVPTINLVQTNPSPKALLDFKNRYIETWRTQPTWISALSYDAMNIAIKAAANAEEGGDLNAFLASQRHYSLGAYELAAGAQPGDLPLGLMPVRVETLGFLP